MSSKVKLVITGFLLGAFVSWPSLATSGTSGTVVTVRNDDSAQVLERLAGDSRLETLVVSRETSTEDSVIVRVTYERDDERRFEASVEVGRGEMHVTGRSMDYGFEHRLRAREDGSFVATWTFGDRLTVERRWPDSADKVEAELGGFQEYRAVVEASGALEPIRAIERLVSSLAPGQRSVLDGFVGIALLGLDGRVRPMGPIGDYLDCLHESCSECSGCWDPPNGPCHGCPQDGFWEQLGSFGCYQLGAEICWFRLLSPIKVPGK